MAKAQIYCTHKQLKRVYPQIDSFDAKTPIYGWTLGFDGFTSSGMDIWYATNTGLVTQLYIDGTAVEDAGFPTASTTDVRTEMTAANTQMLVDDETGFATDDIIKVDNEDM